MRLRITEPDQCDQSMYSVPVIDEETNKTAGQVIFSQPSGRSIYLFNEKYKGKFDTQAECVAFVKGVEAVLNHMISGMDRRSINSPGPRSVRTSQISELSF